MSAVDAERPKGEWPGWMEDVLNYAPIRELETCWKAAVGDAITEVLDHRASAAVRRQDATRPTGDRQ